MRIFNAVLVAHSLAFLLATAARAADDAQMQYGAESNPTGDPIGGGKGYRRIIEKGDFTVANADELLAALKKANSGQVVYIAPGAAIDLTGLGVSTGIFMRPGVTLAGNRGKDGSPGPLLFVKEMPDQWPLLHPNSNCRITGLRLKGPHPNLANSVSASQSLEESTKRRTTGIRCYRDVNDAEVDNCEISNFEYSGITHMGLRGNIHHNFIHDVPTYPVMLASGGQALIEANRIHWNWHLIAGDGTPGNGYEARYNIAVKQPPPPAAVQAGRARTLLEIHAFDMHANMSLPPGGIAGDRILIHHNTLLDNGKCRSFCIRGVPRDIAEIHHNWFSESPQRHAEWLAEQTARSKTKEPPPAFANVWVHDNVYGAERKVEPIWLRTTPHIKFNQPPPPSKEPFKLAGKLALDIEVSVCKGLSLKGVVVRLDKRQIFEGTNAPRAGEVVINASELNAGLHTLTVIARDDRGTTAEVVTQLSVEK